MLEPSFLWFISEVMCMMCEGIICVINFFLCTQQGQIQYQSAHDVDIKALLKVWLQLMQFQDLQEILTYCYDDLLPVMMIDFL